MGISYGKSEESIGVAWIKKLRLITKSQLRILILGLDNVGKTTMIYTLELGLIKTTIPVLGCHRETFEWKNIKILSWDLGGADIVRHPCQKDFNNSQIILYLVDSEDRDHIADSRKEFFDVMSTPGIQDSVVLVIANKQDLENCMSVDEVRERIGFENLDHVKYKTIIGASLTNPVDLQKCLNCVEEQFRLKSNK